MQDQSSSSIVQDQLKELARCCVEQRNLESLSFIENKIV